MKKNTIRESIIAREAEKRTLLSVNAVKRQMAMEDLDKAARTFGLNIDRMLKNMDGAINKTSFELDALSSSLSLSNDALSGNAKSGATSLDSINILKNQGAYSEKDNERARGQAGAFLELIQKISRVY